jgi:hypothetical protein
MQETLLAKKMAASSPADEFPTVEKKQCGNDCAERLLDSNTDNTD